MISNKIKDKAVKTEYEKHWNQQLAPQSGEVVLYNPDDTIMAAFRQNK